MDPYEFNKDECVWGKRIGSGSFGDVFEVEYQGKKYAAKKISKLKLLTEDDQKYLKNEIEILKKMSRCENSVKLIYNYNENGNAILILELCDCELSDLLNTKNDGFDSAEIYKIMTGLNNAFKFMNQCEIIHRDIKLENIMIKYTNSSKTDFIPKINDYGISRILQNGIASTLCGSPLYMAPEVLLNKPYSDKADLWSIGVMIYLMHFNENPFDLKLNPNNLAEKNIKNMLDKKKKKSSNDQLLDDLIDRLLTYDPNKRLNWNDYFNHPFFNREKDDKKDNKKEKVIKIYDFILEKMVLHSFYEKKIIESDKINNPDKFISIKDCFIANDNQYWILGILAKYLRNLGILSIIEKDDLPKNIVDLNYSKTLLQFIANGYLIKHKYILDFGLTNNRIKQLVLDDIERCTFNEKIKNIFLKTYNLNDEELIITNYKRNKNQYTSIIIFKSDFNKDITKNELLNVFQNDDDLKTLANVEKELIIPSIRLSKSMLEASKNNMNDSKWGKNETRGGEPYYPPIGWYKYGLKVSGRYDNKNNDWLGFNNSPGEWCIAYCPLTGINKKIQQTYENDNDIKHYGKKIGVGVYCSPKPDVLENMTEQIEGNVSNFKIGFMIRVKPDKIRCPESNKDIWVVNGNDDEFRPYGILSKKM